MLDINTTIQRYLTKNSKPTKLFKLIPSLIKDPKKHYILYNHYFYLSILNIIKNKKKDTIDPKEIKEVFLLYTRMNESNLKSKFTLDKNSESFNIKILLELLSTKIDPMLICKLYIVIISKYFADIKRTFPSMDKM